MKLIITTLLSLNTLLGQVNTFSKIFSNFPLNSESGVSILEVSNYYFALTGYFCLDNDNNGCTCLLKLDKKGNIIWKKTYNFYPVLNPLIYYDSKLFISGHTNELKPDFTLYCIDLEGNILWNQVYETSNDAESYPTGTMLNNKLYYIGGKDTLLGNFSTHIFKTIVIDTNGQFITSKTSVLENRSESAYNMIYTSSNKLLVGAKICDDPFGCFDEFRGAIIEVDSVGNISIFKKLTTSTFSGLCIIEQVDNGTLGIQWYSKNATLPMYDSSPPAIFYTNLNGETKDSVVFWNQNLNEMWSMTPTGDGGIVGCGYAYIDYLGTPNAPVAGWICKVNPQKKIEWQKRYLDTLYGAFDAEFISIKPTKDNGYIAVGSIVNNMTGVLERHIWLLKLDAEGCYNQNCDSINYLTTSLEPIFLQGQDIKVFPNPAVNTIKVKLPERLVSSHCKAYLVDQHGKTILQDELDNSENILRVEKVSNGQYYLLVLRKNEILNSVKVQIKH